MQQIGRYELERELGQGAMATVYQARDTKLDRLVALKLLHAEVEDPDLRRRFSLEAKSTANLKHPNIVEIFDYSDEDASRLYLVMEWITGPSLRQLLDDHGPMSEQTALCLGLHLTDALRHAHQAGIVHRDLKPSNVMLQDGRVVLVDFGGLKLLPGDGGGALKRVDETRVIGTPGFMAPEQFEGRNVDGRTDLFALGALMYHLTTGRMPYTGDTPTESYDRARRGRFRDPRDHQPLLTPGFCYLLADCLAVKSAERTESADELASQIEPLLAAHGIEDVAAELVRYQKNPKGTHAVQQGRSVEALIRDLRVALLRELQFSKQRRKSSETDRVLQRLQHLDSLEADEAADLKNSRGVLHATRSHKRGLYSFVGLSFGIVLTLVTLYLWLGPQRVQEVLTAQGIEVNLVEAPSVPFAAPADELSTSDAQGTGEETEVGSSKLFSVEEQPIVEGDPGEVGDKASTLVADPTGEQDGEDGELPLEGAVPKTATDER